jgi:hypothetical protein
VDRIDAMESEGIGRRAFLGLLGLGLIALLPGQAWARPRHRKKTVYRLSTRAHRTCTACKGHAANRYYKTREAADADRSHAGCNCAIVSQRIKRGLAKQYFKKRRQVFDLRWQETA